MAKVFSKINLKEYESSRLQDACADAFGTIFLNPLLTGSMVTADLKAGKDNFIPHKLSLQFQYYFVTRKSAAADIYEVDPKTYDNKLFLGLRTSADVSVSLWVV